MVLHDFEEEGHFIGIVSARNTESDVVYASVFPFEVGYTGLGYWPWIVARLIALQLQYLLMSGRWRQWMAGSAAVMLLTLPVLASAEALKVTWQPLDGDVTINRIHSWELQLSDSEGNAIERR